jgi:hypothetical protein
MGAFEEYRFVAKNPPVLVEDSGGRPDFFFGPLFPERVRTQIMSVLRATVGQGLMAGGAWRAIVRRFDYEMGTSNLGRGGGFAESAVENFMRVSDGIEVLDLVALALLWAKGNKAFDTPAADVVWQRSLSPQQGIDDVNRFFREANVPYQFEHDAWVHVASGFAHAEIVRPALDALARPGFEGALAEFQTALGHARDRHDKEAVTEATKAVESTMKCICAARGWTYPENATAKTLFDVVAANGLVPAWMEGAIIPVVIIRNKKSAHGQGPKHQQLPPYAADLAVNLAASSVLALMVAHDTL